jgi:hypothetical protein
MSDPRNRAEGERETPAGPPADDDRDARSGGSADTPPPLPDEDDDSPLGDTDQHSDEQA